MRKRWNDLLCTALLPIMGLVISSTGAAEPETLTLRQLAQELRARNAQFIQAEQERQQIEARIPQALAWDQPMIGMEQAPVPSNPANINRSQGMSYRLTQTMSFPGKKRLAADILEAEAGSAGAQIDGLYVDLLAELKRQYYQLLALQQQAEINRNTLERLNQVKQVAKVRYANNAAAFVDYMNAQVAQGSAENDVYQTQRQIEQTQQGLNTLIGRNPTQALTVAVEPLEALNLRPLTELIHASQGQHPNLRNSAYRIQAARKNLDLAKKAYYPDMQVILTKNSNHPPYGLAGNEYGVEVDLILPTWFFEREKAGVSEANAGVISAQAGAELAWRQVQLEIANAYSQIQQVLKEKELLQQRRLPEAQAAYRLALNSYANNAGDFNGLLLAQQNLRDTELSAAWVDSALQQAKAALDAAMGLGMDTP
ncbi:TolC family protein [Methylobacillus arboreus]|uniref:TolC family protein n=1 Tax=Methylobacillus arboreus TaxID=755170 RepID=UPI001E4E69FE|nr:TolC family protein [Methylobacillus arboreus]MCB5189934.1 TolC family protein [Methylobacillus arboreus]